MVKLRKIAHARSGDKGDILNISLIPYDEKDYKLLKERVTEEKVKEHFEVFASLARQKKGLPWIRLAVLKESRRNEEARQLIVRLGSQRAPGPVRLLANNTPPGRNTRTISARVARASGKNSNDSRQATASKTALGKGSRVASCQSNVSRSW